MLNRISKQKHQALAFLVLLTISGSRIAWASKEIKWEKSIQKGITQAQETAKPVMVWFYTDW